MKVTEVKTINIELTEDEASLLREIMASIVTDNNTESKGGVFVDKLSAELEENGITFHEYQLQYYSGTITAIS